MEVRGDDVSQADVLAPGELVAAVGMESAGLGAKSVPVMSGLCRSSHSGESNLVVEDSTGV